MASGDEFNLFIETLYGATLELRVLPADTIFSIKLRLGLYMGIPVSEQHLIWLCQELPNTSSLIECNITKGSTLKLVVGMRGGPCNIRKTSAAMPLSIFGVFKNAAKKLPEASCKKDLCLNAPRPRAEQTAMIWPLVNTGSVSSPRSFSDQSARELRGEDSALESRWHRENIMMRQKVELLQQKLKSCRLRKEGGSGSPDESLVLALKPIFEPECELHTGKVLPELKEVAEIETGAKAPAARDMSAEQVYELFPSPKSVQKTRRQFCHGPVDDCWINPNPDTLPHQRPFAGATSRILSEGKVDGTLPRILVSSASGTRQKDASSLWRQQQSCSTQKSLSYGSDVEARSTIDESLPKWLPEPGTTETVKQLFPRAHCELSQVSNEPKPNLSRLGTYTADHGCEKSHILYEPKLNFPPKNNREWQSTGAGSSAGFNSSGPVPQVASVTATSISRSAYDSPKENCETGEISQEPSQSQLHPLKGKKKLAKRCVKCNRKIGLASTYVCRCGNNFCAAHRYAELHHCDYDYKAEGRQILQNSNNFIKGSKFPKI